MEYISMAQSPNFLTVSMTALEYKKKLDDDNDDGDHIHNSGTFEVHPLQYLPA